MKSKATTHSKTFGVFNLKMFTTKTVVKLEATYSTLTITLLWSCLKYIILEMGNRFCWGAPIMRYREQLHCWQHYMEDLPWSENLSDLPASDILFVCVQALLLPSLRWGGEWALSGGGDIQETTCSSRGAWEERERCTESNWLTREEITPAQYWGWFMYCVKLINYNQLHWSMHKRTLFILMNKKCAHCHAPVPNSIIV